MLVNNLCGEFGGKIIKAGESGDTGVVYHYAIVLQDTVLSVLTQPAFVDKSSAAALTEQLSKTYPAETVIYGQISAITCTSGLLQLVEWANRGVE